MCHNVSIQFVVVTPPLHTVQLPVIWQISILSSCDNIQFSVILSDWVWINWPILSINYGISIWTSMTWLDLTCLKKQKWPETWPSCFWKTSVGNNSIWTILTRDLQVRSITLTAREFDWNLYSKMWAHAINNLWNFLLVLFSDSEYLRASFTSQNLCLWWINRKPFTAPQPHLCL